MKWDVGKLFYGIWPLTQFLNYLASHILADRVQVSKGAPTIDHILAPQQKVNKPSS